MSNKVLRDEFEQITGNKIEEDEFEMTNLSDHANAVSFKKAGPQKYMATKGHSFPIFYKGSIIRIGDTEPVEIEVSHLSYDGRSQFQRALDNNQILEVGA